MSDNVAPIFKDLGKEPKGDFPLHPIADRSFSPSFFFALDLFEKDFPESIIEVETETTVKSQDSSSDKTPTLVSFFKNSLSLFLLLLI
jgi:hypothetical protein